MAELYWDDVTGQGISIRMIDEENDNGLRGVGDKTIGEKQKDIGRVARERRILNY
jgi:hypothetical protein